MEKETLMKRVSPKTLAKQAEQANEIYTRFSALLNKTFRVHL